MKRLPEPVKPWRDMLLESFGHVRSIGGLFALDFEYYLESESNRWTSRLAAETRSGRLMRHDVTKPTERTSPSTPSSTAFDQDLRNLLAALAVLSAKIQAVGS
jgi:hypothetical protein